MSKLDRKAALEAFRNRKPQIGVFALRLAGQGTWVGTSMTLDKAENRHRFTLTLGTHPNAGLQAAFGAVDGAMTYEILEVLPEDTEPVARDRLLKERHAHWCSALAAQGL